MDGRQYRPQGELIMRRALEDSLSLLAGVGVGTALMYLLDPDNGPDRRERVVENTRYALSNAGDVMSDASHRIADSARSAWSEMGSNLNDQYDDGADAINRDADQLKSGALVVFPVRGWKVKNVVSALRARDAILTPSAEQFQSLVRTKFGNIARLRRQS